MQCRSDTPDLWRRWCCGMCARRCLCRSQAWAPWPLSVFQQWSCYWYHCEFRFHLQYSCECVVYTVTIKTPSPWLEKLKNDFLFFNTCKASKVHSEVSKLGANWLKKLTADSIFWILMDVKHCTCYSHYVWNRASVPQIPCQKMKNDLLGFASQHSLSIGSQADWLRQAKTIARFARNAKPYWIWHAVCAGR